MADSRHEYWAAALETLLQEIESNGHQVNVDDFNIQVWSSDLTTKTKIGLVDGKWKVQGE